MLMQANGNNELASRATPGTTPWDFAVDIDGTLRDWLVSDRLMTPDIRRSFADPLRISVLREEQVRLPADVIEVMADCPDDGWLREITMHAGDTLLVHALCFAPESTCLHHPWLLSLGEQPLGGTLAALDDVHRVSKSYCRSDRLADGIRSMAGAGAWSRRSLFDLQGTPLVLVEHLSTALTSHTRIVADESR